MWLYTLNTRILGRYLGLYWRLGLYGDVASIPKEGPLIVSANHSSFMDPWFIAMCFPRPVRYLMTDKWYYKSPFWEGFFRAYGTIPVSGGSPTRTIAKVARHVSAGDAVGVFPEGKISNDGRLQQFRSGVARIAARTGAPVVPVGIRGAFESLPRSRRFPRPSRVSVHVGPPLYFTGKAQNRDPRPAEIQVFNNVLLARIGELSNRPVTWAGPSSFPLLRKAAVGRN